MCTRAENSFAWATLSGIAEYRVVPHDEPPSFCAPRNRHGRGNAARAALLGLPPVPGCYPFDTCLCLELSSALQSVVASGLGTLLICRPGCLAFYGE